nr:hypothetical protein [Tanacetum cinerariifolium]
PRVPGQSCDELPFEDEILEFLRFLGHSAEIKTLTDVNVNKLFQPWRSFAAVINKCLTGKSTSFDSLRLSQAQILWGLYHRRNVDYAFLIWEDFVYQVEHKNQKKSNEMYYPRFTKVIIHHFMTKKPSIPRRNKVNWHYVRDDILFSIIKVVSRHQNTQQYGAILPIELTTEDIRNTKAYKEYYACATGEAAPIPKVGARRKRGGSASSTTPPTPIATPTPLAAPRLSAAAKGKQPARATSPIDPSNVERTEAEQLKIVLKRSRQETHISQHGAFSTDEGTGSKPGVPDVPSDDSKEEISWNSFDDEDVDDQTKGSDDKEESNEGDDEETVSDGESKEEKTREQEEESFDPISRTPEESKDDGNGEEDQDLRISEEERMHEEEEADELYRDKIIKERVKSQVKAQVTRILPRIEESVNAQLEAEVLTRSSHSSRTSYAVAADLSEMELKKILINKMEGNKSIQRSDEQRNLYKALVKAYDVDKTILDSYGESAILKRRREEDDDQEGPSVGSDRGSTTGTQSRQMSASESALAEEPMQTTCQMEEPSHPVFETGAEDQPIVQPSQHPEWFSQPRKPPTPDRDWNKSLPAAQRNAQSWISALAKPTDARSSFNELLDTPIDFSNFIMNRLGIDTLTSELLAGPTFELMRGSCNSLTELEYHLEEPLPLIPDNQGRRVIPFEYFINNDLEYLRGGDSNRKYTTSVTKTKAADYGHIKWIEDLVPRTMWIQEPINYDQHALWGVSHWEKKRQQFYGFAVNQESALDVYSKRRIIAKAILKGYPSKTLKICCYFLYKRRVEDLQLGVESYQKRLNLTKPDTMQYLPTTIWRKGDNDRAVAMIQAIDKMLKTMIIMRSLERFVGGRQYEGDF